MFLVDDHNGIYFPFNVSGEGKHSLLTSGLHMHMYTYAGIPSHIYKYAHTKREEYLAIGKKG